MITILVTDDDHRLRHTVRWTLSHEGVRIVTASDGQEALVQVSVLSRSAQTGAT